MPKYALTDWVFRYVNNGLRSEEKSTGTSFLACFSLIRYFLATLICIGQLIAISQPRISFTFDDGVTTDRPGYTFEVWNEMILDHLDQANVKAIFFVTGSNKTDQKGQYLLESWNNRGHGIGNHSYSHPNFNKEEIGVAIFMKELLGTDTIISAYSNYCKFFRFPYLKEGDSWEEVIGIRHHLKEQGYKNGHVTIDASDWYVDSRLRKRLRENPKAAMEGFRKFYVEHLFDRAMYYENLSYQLTGRHINHTLLLHHNLTAALFLGDLICEFQDQGWLVISAKDAYQDPIFETTPNHSGESLIWSMAKDTGKFDDILRYPAEDSRYEKNKMDALGL